MQIQLESVLVLGSGLWLISSYDFFEEMWVNLFISGLWQVLWNFCSHDRNQEMNFVCHIFQAMIFHEHPWNTPKKCTKSLYLLSFTLSFGGFHLLQPTCTQTFWVNWMLKGLLECKLLLFSNLVQYLWSKFFLYHKFYLALTHRVIFKSLIIQIVFENDFQTVGKIRCRFSELVAQLWML